MLGDETTRISAIERYQFACIRGENLLFTSVRLRIQFVLTTMLASNLSSARGSSDAPKHKEYFHLPKLPWFETALHHRSAADFLIIAFPICPFIATIR